MVFLKLHYHVPWAKLVVWMLSMCNLTTLPPQWGSCFFFRRELTDNSLWKTSILVQRGPISFMKWSCPREHNFEPLLFVRRKRIGAPCFPWEHGYITFPKDDIQWNCNALEVLEDCTMSACALSTFHHP
jgi:hypothetical protein